MTSCCRPNCYDPGNCCDPGNIEIPYTWPSPIKEGMNSEDPSCFLWWEALHDPVLSSLIIEATNRNRDVLLAGLESKNKFLKARNDVSAEVAKNYIEFRGLQMRLSILNENIKAQRELLTLNKDLSKGGFFDEAQEIENQKNLESLWIQQSLINFSMEKITFHLSALLSYQPNLCPSQGLPNLVENTPIGCPTDLICQDPSINEARKQYVASGTKQALYNYQKTVLETLESAETALAAFNYERDKLHRLENAKSLKLKSLQLTKYLNSLGLKDDRDVLLASQELLSEEDSVIQGKVDLLTSYINLYRVLSSDWEACCD